MDEYIVFTSTALQQSIYLVVVIVLLYSQSFIVGHLAHQLIRMLK